MNKIRALAEKILNNEYLLPVIGGVILAAANIFEVSLVAVSTVVISAFIMNKAIDKIATNDKLVISKLLFAALLQAMILFPTTIIITVFLYFILQIQKYNYTLASPTTLFSIEFILFLVPYLIIFTLWVWKNAKKLLVKRKVD